MVRITALTLVLSAFCLSGCGEKGPKLWPVSGQVAFRGSAVSAGMVCFSNPSAGIDILAELGYDGVYSVRMAKGVGLPEGTYSVCVVPPRAKLPLGAMTPPPPPKFPDIPEKYRDASTSGLSLTVKPGNNRFDINMEPGK
jgi:hypothetical protein